MMQHLLLPDTNSGSKDGADDHSHKHPTCLLNVPAVLFPKDQRDGAKGEVEYSPGKGGPEGEEEDDGLGEEQVKGPEDGGADHVGERGAFFVFFDFPADAFQCLCRT